MQTKFLIYIIIGVLVVGGVAGASWYFVTRQPAPPVAPVPSPEEAPPPVVQPPEEVPPEVPADETADWKTYRNEKYGYEIKYPEGLAEEKEKETWIELIPSRYTESLGIRGIDERLEIIVTQDTTLKDCPLPSIPAPYFDKETRKRVLIGGKEFYNSSISDCGAGFCLARDNYFIMRENDCFLLSFFWEKGPGFDFFLEELSPEDRFQIKEKLKDFLEKTKNQMLSTFRFLR